MKHTQKGFNLLELMLAMVFIVAASAAAYKLFGTSNVQAAVQREQKDVGVMVDKIIGSFVAYPNFQPISTVTVAGILNMPTQYNATTQTIPTNLKSDLQITPDKLLSDNDSFRLTYKNVDKKTCVALIPALASRSSGVFVGGNANIQIKQGQEPDGAIISTQCASANTVDVGFRFTSDKSNFAATSMNACLCAPETETQTLACPANSAGSITQRRTSMCTGGTPSCPSPQWSSWVTASNTCGANAPPVTPTTPVAPVAPQTCVPSVETQTVACPSGQVGGVLQQRSRTCPANTWGAWANVSSSCQPDPNRPACIPGTRRETVPCPGGQGGQILQERASTCDANGNEVWSNDWKTINSTCTASCVATGNCCTVSRQTSTDLQYCGVGRYGSVQRDLYKTSTCATATSAPVWPSDWSIRNSTGRCTDCPTPVQDQETQTVAASAACPAGQTGSHTWSSSQVRTRTRSYDCSSDRTINLPAPTIGAWSGWSEVARSGEVNTCSSQALCSDGSAQVASWAEYDSNSDYDFYQQVASADDNSGSRHTTGNYSQSHQVGDTYNSYIHLPTCTLSNLGAVGLSSENRFECVSNMGMHYCDYNNSTDWGAAYKCVSACASSFDQYGYGRATVDGQTRYVRKATDQRQLAWHLDQLSWGRPSYPGPNVPSGPLSRADRDACENNPFQQYDEFKWVLKNPNGGIENGACRISRNGTIYVRTCSGTYNGQTIAPYTGDRDTAYSGLPYKDVYTVSNTVTSCVAGESYERFSCSKSTSISRDVASCNK